MAAIRKHIELINCPWSSLTARSYCEGMREVSLSVEELSLFSWKGFIMLLIHLIYSWTCRAICKLSWAQVSFTVWLCLSTFSWSGKSILRRKYSDDLLWPTEMLESNWISNAFDNKISWSILESKCLSICNRHLTILF